MGNIYKKNKGYADAEGVKFQLDLVIVTSLNALLYHEDWKVSSENKKAGKFDDIVIELSDRTAILIQAKSKKNERNNITKEQFLSTRKNADFSLAKYFFSYEEIKSGPEDKTVIICTNADIDKQGLNDTLTCHYIYPQNILQYESSNCTFFIFNENVLPEFKESVETYFKNHLQDGDTNKDLITDENMKSFLQNLQIFSNYPSGEHLQKIIEKLLSRLNTSMWGNISYHEIYRKVEDWLKQPIGEFLTKTSVAAMLCEIISDKYGESLNNLNITFDRNDFNFKGSKQIYHILTENGYLMQMLKVYHALKEDKCKKLFINPDNDIDVQEQIIEAFRRRRYTFLIIILIDTTADIEKQITIKLSEMLEKDRWKKVILVTKSNKIAQQIGLENISVNESITFGDISKDSRERLLKNKNIIFQGKNINLEELLESDTIDVHTKLLNLGMLEKLVLGEEIKIGEQLLDLNDEIVQCYIRRIFQRETNAGKYTFPEESLFDVNEKVILISDSAGMGKTTVLTKIAAYIKAKCSRMWVIRINLNNYTKILKEHLRKNKNTISVIELLNSKKETKITNMFEKFVFCMDKKIVLMLDGIDEISPDYTDLIIDLILQCQKASNFAKIFVTTRPHMTLEVEAVLKVESFKMLPLTKSNQIDFLANYWTYNLQLNYTNEKKCKQYAETLINKMSSWIESYRYWENTFATIPLHVEMLAEVFKENNMWDEFRDWEGCKEYLEGDGVEPKLPKKLNIVRLYDTFIEKKRDVFVSKENPNGNPATNTALFNQFQECLVCYNSLALKIILNERERDLFTCYQRNYVIMEEYILKMGIVQKLGQEFQFIHRTFSEYFVALSIIQELKIQNLNAEFQKFLIDDILVHGRFEVVCAFLNILLQKVSLPPNIFKNYCSRTGKTNFNLIFQIARKGHVAILQLILTSLNFRIIRCQEIDIDDWRIKITFKKRNTLNNLKVLLQTAGVNIKDKNGDTPLHYAVRGGHLEMVNFLVTQGADNYVRNKDGSAASHLAAELGMLNIVRYFVENCAGENISILYVKDGIGRTVLHLAAKRNRLDTVKYLVENGAMVNVRESEGYTALHLAAKWGHYGTVKFLTEHGAIINVRDNGGNTPLHLAVTWSHLNVIEYLVKHDGDVNIRNSARCTPLHLAAKWRNWNAVKYLVEHTALVNVVDSKGCTPLHLAAEWNDCNIIEYLVEHGAVVNVRDSKGWTPLHLVASRICMNSVKYLVEHGAMVNDVDSEGRTSLHLAAEWSNQNIIEYLVEQGAVTDVRDNRGWTPLHSAAYKNCTDNIKYLLDNNMHINIRDNKGCTALHLAVEWGDLDTVEILVRYGACVNVKDNRGRTPLHLAVQKDNMSIVKYFKTNVN